MLWWLDIKAAARSLATARLRTGLTMLGVIIGVASITVVLALGEGLKNKLSSQTQQPGGSSVLSVRPGQTTRDPQGKIASYNFFAAVGTSTLDERDLATVQQTKGVTAAAPIMAITGSVSTQSNANAKVSATSQQASAQRSQQRTQPPTQRWHILATNPALARTLNLQVQSGQFLDDSLNQSTVVLGSRLASQLLGSDTAIGSKLYLRSQEFTVIGILKPSGQQPGLANIYDLNDAAFITLDAGKAFNHGVAQIQQMNVRLHNPAEGPQVAQALHTALLANHNGEEDFTVLQPAESLALSNALIGTLTNFTTAVAGISLLVGGIGIMNIMLVSVTERTREIGIRKAVGATNSQVLKQFLIEALLMCGLGGLIGMLLAYAIAFGIGVVLEFMPVITWRILLTAGGVSMAAGLIFGLTPALKAARKDPIEALRYLQ